jgi:hypothetical protein
VEQAVGLVSRSRRALVALAFAALLAGCGGSVTDVDGRRAAPATSRAASTDTTQFCSAVQANADALRPLGGLTLRGPVSVDQLTAAVQAARLSGVVLRSAAPDAIRGDVERTVAALDVQLNALVAAGGDTQTAARDPKVAAQLSSPDLAAAGNRVASYVSQNCPRTGSSPTPRS